MAERRRGKKRKEEFPDKNEDKVEKPSKDEYDIAAWLKKNVPHKKTKFLGHNVEYFTGTKAVDALMSSQWAKPKKEGDDPFFATREHCIEFLDMMLSHRFFHRAKKILQDKVQEGTDARKKKPIKEKKADEKEIKKEKKTDEKEVKKDKKKEKKMTSEQEDQGDSSHAEGKKSEREGGDDERKKKKKVRLEMHLEQLFADTLDAYVWIYNPMPIYYPIFGALVVLAAIGICLFPLWPASVRTLVYYLSVAGACFLIGIVLLSVFRSILFAAVWLVSFGKHHLWIFPNLTEDVGFFASFWPLYHYEYKGTAKKKEKLSDNEDEDSEREHDKDESANEGDSLNAGSGDGEMTAGDKEGDDAAEEEMNDEDEGNESAVTDSEGSGGSQTGKDFEMVDKGELQ